MNKKILSIVILVSSFFPVGLFAQTQENEKKTRLGFGFGIKTINYSDPSFTGGTANFFRFNFRDNERTIFYIHTENGNFNIKEGDAQSTGTQSSQGVGGLIELYGDFYLDVMIGNSNIVVPASRITGSPSISQSTGSGTISELGVMWVKYTSRIALDLGLSYRYHRLAQSISITQKDGTAKELQNKDSINLNLAIGYDF